MSGSQNLTFSLPERRIGFFRSCLNRGSFQACLKNISRVYSYQRNKQFMKYMFVLYFFLIHRELSKLIAQKTRKYDEKNTSAGLKSCLSSIQVHSSRRSLYSWFPLHFNILKNHFVTYHVYFLYCTKRNDCHVNWNVQRWTCGGMISLMRFNNNARAFGLYCIIVWLTDGLLDLLTTNCTTYWLKQVPGQLTDWTTYWLNNWLTERPTAFWQIEWLTEGWAKWLLCK